MKRGEVFEEPASRPGCVWLGLLMLVLIAATATAVLLALALE
jgi:hypothetical protein